MHLLAYLGLLLTLPAMADTQVPLENEQTNCDPSLQNCAEAEKRLGETEIEVLTILGNRPTPLSQDARGYYTLDQEMMKSYSFGNGSLNELLAVLPGVQFAEGAYAASQVSNIKPPEVSIAGALGYQTGYLIDGIGNNSKLSTGNAQADRNLIQDVSGHSQQTFINVNLLDDVQVFDSNIPAKYGDFSGGLVLANTKHASNSANYGISLRRTADALVNYKRFFAPDFDAALTSGEATFSKLDLNVYASLPLSSKSGLVTQFQVLESSEAFDQLGNFREQVQRNYNGMIKYHNEITNKDTVELRYLYAPYTGDYFDVSAANSDFNIEGGGQSLLLKWEARRALFDMETQLSWSFSENSKRAPNVWFVWQNLPGRQWGNYTGSTSSIAGGFGDIDKTQNDIRFGQDFVFDSYDGLGINHSLSAGYQLTQQQTEFARLEDSILYNGAQVAIDIKCGAYKLDCLETTFKRPINELEAELGRPLNFLLPQDILLFQANIETSGQFFRSRQLSPQSTAKASVNSLSMYFENSMNLGDLGIVIGARYDYNDFFKNHNIAPRMRADYTFFEDYQIIFGANRYYQSDLANYKLNEAIEPFIAQVRHAQNNQPGPWLSAIVPSGPRYKFTDTVTPFSDELTLAYRQVLFSGTIELRYVDRTNKQVINRRRGFNDLGEPILFAENQGESRYKRVSLTWMLATSSQNIEFNISRATNTLSRANFDGATTRSNGNNSSLNFTFDDSELVFLRKSELGVDGVSRQRQDLITRNDLALERQDSNRPLIANVSWAGKWNNWQLSAHARYLGEQDAVFPTNETATFIDADSICAGCTPNRREYPVYRLSKRPNFTLVNANVRYGFALSNKDIITFGLSVQNVFDSRTYQVGPFTTGIELGRQVWFDVSYDH